MVFNKYEKSLPDEILSLKKGSMLNTVGRPKRVKLTFTISSCKRPF